MNSNFTFDLEKAMEHFHKQGAFLTVGNEKEANTMTISWGTIGFMWKKPVFTVMVRPSRYSYDILENGGEFTVSIPYSNKMKNALTICGTKSGRDIDKLKEAGIEYVTKEGFSVPVVKDCDMYYQCKVIYKHVLKDDKLPVDIKENSYKDGDIHTLYYGEILNCFKK